MWSRQPVSLSLIYSKPETDGEQRCGRDVSQVPVSGRSALHGTPTSVLFSRVTLTKLLKLSCSHFLVL